MEERWLLANSMENAVQIDDNEEDETLSLCDLPIIHQQVKKDEGISHKIENQEEFDFCCAFSKPSQMCAADDVFFQGQILPLRDSVSSEKGLLQYSGYTRSVSRSESMDHSSYSSGLISSRSSSIGSGTSSGSGSSNTTVNRRKNHPKPPRNVFHSHPSPSPRISRLNNKKPTNVNTSNPNFVRKSSVWSIFRLGLLIAPPPDIAFQGTGNKNFGSRKSTSSNTSGGPVKNAAKNKKRISDLLNGGGCKCSADAVATVPSRVVVIKRSATESEETTQDEEEEKKVAMRSPKLMKKQEAKKQMSHHRTFEWLKQLSLEDSSAGGEV